jgi:hypothetical protein
MSFTCAYQRRYTSVFLPHPSKQEFPPPTLCDVLLSVNLPAFPLRLPLRIPRNRKFGGGLKLDSFTCPGCGAVVYPSRRDFERRQKLCLCGSCISLKPKRFRTSRLKPPMFQCDFCRKFCGKGLTVLMERHFINDPMADAGPRIFKSGSIVCQLHLDKLVLIPCGKDIE